MTFTIKLRGGGRMLAEYECPVHGRFEEVVDRDVNGDPPTRLNCAAWVDGDRCEEPSPWRISMPAVHTQFVVSASHGRNDAKPHPKAMDTRMLAEGRKKDFRAQRKKIREDERHARLKRFLS